ncbi:neprilysin-11 [Stomoxys calcitrans]|uniref:neprilysin-11 n=1 Tax=Stomoxys calcitrans TaxID=35570 RepID=UPI0027E36C30|nr:neprilysin-11 [Stomoxys calcitrans]
MLERQIFLSALLALILASQAYAAKANRNQQQTKQRQAQNYQNTVPIGPPVPEFQTIKERHYTSGEMLKLMNLEGDPCMDFYDYVCGNWLQAQNVSESEENQIITLNNRMELNVIRLLQRKFEYTNNTNSVVYKFYRSCISATEEDQRAFAKGFVSSYGGLPDIKDTWRERSYQWNDIIAKLKLDYNLDILITFSNLPNGRPVLSEPQSTILPTELCNSEAASQIDEKDEIFDAIQMDIKDKLQAWFAFEEADATRLAGDIQRFEFDLCKYMRKSELLNVAPPGEEETAAEDNSTARGPGVRNRAQNRNNAELENNPRLNNFVSQMLGLAQGQARSEFEATSSAEYLQYLISINGRKPSFANYIIYRALSELTLPVGQPPEERQTFCIRKAMQTFPEYVGNLYQSSIGGRFKDFMKQDIASIFREIKEAVPRNMKKYVDSLQVSEPLYAAGPATEPQSVVISVNGNYWEILKSVIITNNQQQAPQMGATGQQRGRSNTPLPSVANVVEAFATNLASNEKHIQFGYGLLKPPFYFFNYPRSLKYSSLGFVLARELVKRYIDEQQSLEGRALSSYAQLDLNEFLTNRACFRSQVSGYFFNTPDEFRNGTQLKEIMADASALSIAFLAYNNWLEKQDALSPELKFETMPNMNFSNTQLFFINFAQIRCSAKYTKEEGAGEFLEYFPRDLNTLERWNVNGPLSNDMEFGLDFNCPLGSEMNFGDKCSIISNEFKSGY